MDKKEGVTVNNQMEIGTMVSDCLDRRRKVYADEIQKALSGVAQGFKTHDLMDDRMIINTAFLIDKGWVKDFDKRVEELNTRFDEKVNFRCVGPLPPYSFYTLEVRRMDFKEVDWARRRLGLNDTATIKEIKKAYHTKASSSHPDKNPDRPGIEREFDDAIRAYRILIDYYHACKQVGCPENCPFIEEEFKKNAILIKLKE